MHPDVFAMIRVAHIDVNETTFSAIARVVILLVVFVAVDKGAPPSQTKDNQGALQTQSNTCGLHFGVQSLDRSNKTSSRWNHTEANVQ